MFATQNIQLKFLKIILIILKLMTTIIATLTYFTSLFLYMFINHLTEGIENIKNEIKIDDEDMNQIITKK